MATLDAVQILNLFCVEIEQENYQKNYALWSSYGLVYLCNQVTISPGWYLNVRACPSQPNGIERAATNVRSGKYIQIVLLFQAEYFEKFENEQRRKFNYPNGN